MKKHTLRPMATRPVLVATFVATPNTPAAAHAAHGPAAEATQHTPAAEATGELS